MTCFVNTHKIEEENLSEWESASYEYTSVANRQDLVCHMPVVAHVHVCTHIHGKQSSPPERTEKCFSFEAQVH